VRSPTIVLTMALWYSSAQCTRHGAGLARSQAHNGLSSNTCATDANRMQTE
jgi:hypothetical protein